jgi:hypothetical protein
VRAIYCSVDGGAYQQYGGSPAQVPVNGVGGHGVSCFAENNAVDPSGAPATSPVQTWALSIREPTVAAVAFSKLVHVLRCHRATKRVHVPGRWVTVLLHHKRLRVRTVGHWRTVRVTRCRGARATKVFKHSVHRVAFGRGTDVTGWLGTSAGTALPGQPVRVYTAPDNGSRQFIQVAQVTTGLDGIWSVRLPRGPSRLVVVGYGGSATTEPAASSAIRLVVPAKVRLHVLPTVTHWRGRVRISGRVLGGYVPLGEKLLRLRIGVAGVRQTFGIADVRPDGRFHTTFKFSPGDGTVRYWFSVSTLRVANYPYAPASSRRVTVTVGPG